MARTSRKEDSFEDNVSEDQKTINDMKKQIDELTRQLQSFISAPKAQTTEEDMDNIRISQEEYIKVISLCPMPLNLSTQGMGRGKVFKFSKFGEVKRILYSDLVEVLESNSHFVSDGFFYVMDKKVIRKHGLDDVYEKLLTKEQIEKIISGNAEKDSIDLFESANKKQQEFICEIFIEKLQNDVDIDLNIVDKISRISKINITERAEEAKAYAAMN